LLIFAPDVRYWTPHPDGREATMSNEPAIGIGHVVLSVSDVEASSRFYEELGLRPCEAGGGLAILELRGGTHLILMPRKDGTGGAASERVDLMISGRTREELETYRDGVVAHGLKASPIPAESLYGHHMFRLRDPDGNEVVVATSHSALTDTREQVLG
jgi:catechol 2,3-dioxygenase-like lactoylglutathione lyase family enzyme